MFYYIQQNKHIIAASVTLFVISLSTLMFFVSPNHDLKPVDYHATVLEDNKNLTQHEQEVLYRTFVHNEEDNLIVLHPDAKIDFVSWDFEVLLGHNFSDIQNKLFTQLLHPDDATLFLNSFHKVIQLGQTVNVIGPYRLRDQHGAYHFHIGTAVPYLEKGKVTKIILVSHDINESFDKNGKPVDLKNTLDTENIEKKSDYSGEKIRNQSGTDGNRLMAEKMLK